MALIRKRGLRTVDHHIEGLREGDGLAGAGSLEALEFMEGMVEGALGAGEGAADLVETISAHGVAADGESVDGSRGDLFALENSLALAVIIGRGKFEEAGFPAEGAEDCPCGGEELGDEDTFGWSGGLVLVVEGPAEAAERGAVFAWKEESIGVEAVAEGVEPDGCAALFGFGPGALERVKSIRLDLFFGSHRFSQPRSG